MCCARTGHCGYSVFACDVTRLKEMVRRQTKNLVCARRAMHTNHADNQRYPTYIEYSAVKCMPRCGVYVESHVDSDMGLHWCCTASATSYCTSGWFLSFGSCAPSIVLCARHMILRPAPTYFAVLDFRYKNVIIIIGLPSSSLVFKDH